MWNPVAPETVERPHAFWAWLREEAPVHAVPEAGYYLVSRYQDVMTVCRDPETYSSELKAIVQRDDAGRPRLQRTELVGEPQSRVLGVADGPVHSAHRRVVGRTFSPARMERMVERAAGIARRLVEAAAAAREIDLIEALAVPLPREVMTRLLGLPLEDQADLQTWTDHAMRLIGGLASSEQLAASWEATNGFQAYLDERFEAALARPGEDVMGDLARAVRAHERGEAGLERWEAVAVLYQLVVGGIETTVGLIGTVVQHAARQPGAWEALRGDPAGVAPFIEECIRLDGPATGNYRCTSRDTKLAGVPLPEGSTLMLLWGSANRDPAEFPEPERFVVDRPNIKAHLGFGLGKHFCLGAALARMETRVALEALLQGTERIALEQEPSALRHKPSLGIRRLQSLPVRLA